MKRILFGLFCSLCITQFSVAQKVKDSAPNTQKSAPNTEKSASNNGVKSPGAEQNVKNHNLEVAKNLEIFNALYKNLDLMYVDTLDANKVVSTGIDAMLRSLDRYTEYYPEQKQKELKTMLTGKYAGIGALIRYHQRLKKVVIEEPYVGMPAQEAGLRKGDIILQIDDTVMTDKNTAFVSSHLRGEAGTTFMLKIERP